MGCRSIDRACSADEPTPEVEALWQAANTMKEWTFDQRLAWVEDQLRRKPKVEEPTLPLFSD
jgi:hypothetical protein